MNDPTGSQWRKWDLHFHTPKSHDHGSKWMSAAEVVDRLVQANVAVVAVTDHHVMDVAFIERMRSAAKDKLTILPGVEFSCPLGGKESVHFIGIFPEDADLKYLAPEILSRSTLSKQRADGRDETELYVDFVKTAIAIRELGGIVSIHAHGKANCIENIASNPALKAQFKKDILREHVDLLEIGNRDRSTDYRQIVFPDIGLSRPLIVGSDDHADARYHADKRYPVEKYCWIKADPTFVGLRMALREPEHRFCLDAVPADAERVAKNKTKYIKSVSFKKLPTMPTGEEWLDGEVPVNPGLVAIIGNKGSGKSALSDCIGMLGSCTTSSAFSFLEKQRFRHPKTGRAEHVEATMSWHDGEPVTRPLSDEISPDEPERVKYLPQSFVEQVCNTPTSTDRGAFEKELKKVVFSKVAPEDRLGKRTLDELVDYRTEEFRSEANDLAQGLLDLGEQRARLEERLDPAVRTGLERQIERKKEEIRSHEATKPEEKDPPAGDPADDPKVTQSIEELEQRTNDRESAVAEIDAQNQIIKDQQRRAATAEKLLAKLENLKSTVQRAIDDMSTEADALSLKPEDLASLTVSDKPVIVIRDEAIRQRDSAREQMESADSDPPTGLVTDLIQIVKRIKEIQENLSRPQQEYQAYLEAKQKWDESLKKLKGSADDPESLIGLEEDLTALDDVPEQIQQIEKEQERIAEAIHILRVKEAAVYTDLYAPVQRFITEHPLASDHLKLEFKVEVVEDGFVEALLIFINQNKMGSFYGVDDGEKAAKKLVASVEWSSWEMVKGFLQAVVDHLHHDKREGSGDKEVLLGSQVGKGKTVAELYRWLYGLGYLSPRYLLRWDGKDVEQLSPGERGTLLLIFYLLVDDSDLPLIIDQPEANLDNVTVAEKLVDCIREARSKRQVIIVTHNPNLAVVCDADQIIHATLDREAGSLISYETGALEHPSMNRFTIKVLEGGREPFDKRDGTYRVVGE